MKKQMVELLAPAGSYESMKAAVAAGADAVYMGGSQFGARAYADNPEQDLLLDAIRYVHLHGRKLYLTINTLMKQSELEEQLYPFLKPYYEEGLDAVIVQDLGTFLFIKREFPDLPIHASTQMTVTGEAGAKMLEQLGADRVVTARELSLEEIRKIRETCNLEIESFVHGALCYCYSGQCLFSSLAGGRSGNRGRCAQPCRMSYEVSQDGKVWNSPKEGFVLSPKDLNTLSILPEIIEAGVYSLKIEGRMKKPEYTAGVVSIYRKYVDRYLQYGKDGYYVEKADQQKLMALFNRKGFTEGYYKMHNGRQMITLTKPDFRDGAEQYNQQLREQYLNIQLKEKIKGNLIISKELPVIIKLSFQDYKVEVHGDYPMEAQNKPLTKEAVQKQMRKTGNTPFEFEILTIELEDDLFVPVAVLNELRRRALEQLEQTILHQYRRRSMDAFAQLKSEKNMQITLKKAEQNGKESNILNSQKSDMPSLHVSVETIAQLKAVCKEEGVKRIYIDSELLTIMDEYEMIRLVHRANKQCWIMLPQIFRTKAKQALKQINWKETQWDGCLIRSMEEIGWLREQGFEKPMAADHMLYTYNRLAIQMWKEQGVVTDTVPVELNANELRQRGTKGSEMIIYGRLPMMVSAQCIKRTTKKCDQKQEVLTLKDRMGNHFPVKNHCVYCYNTIYNSKPLSLPDIPFEKMELAAVRLVFTVEGAKETETIVKEFADMICRGRKREQIIKDFTRGHYKRGVE